MAFSFKIMGGQYPVAVFLYILSAGIYSAMSSSPQPQDIVADSGRTIDLTCNTTQKDVGTLEWRKDGLKLTRGLISSSNLLTLTLLEVEALDVGLYECVSVFTTEVNNTIKEDTVASVYLYVDSAVMIVPPKDTRYVDVLANQKETLIPCRPTLPEIQLLLYGQFNETMEWVDISSHFNMLFDARKGFTVATDHLYSIHGPVTCKIPNDMSTGQIFYFIFVDRDQKSESRSDTILHNSIKIEPYINSTSFAPEDINYLMCNIDASPLKTNISITFLECLNENCSSTSDIATKLDYDLVASDNLTYASFLIPIVRGLYGYIICKATWNQGSLGKDMEDRYLLDNTSKHPHLVLIVTMTVLAMIFVILLLFGTVIVYKRTQKKKQLLDKGIQALPVDEERENLTCSNHSYLNRNEPNEEKNEDELMNMHHPNLKFPLEQLNIKEKIGSGHFGEVFKALATGIKPRQGAEVIEVAVKKTKSGDREQITALTMELEIMSAISYHNNVVNLLGACTKDVARGQIYIIMELCELGSLEKILNDYKMYFKNDLMLQNISLGHLNFSKLPISTVNTSEYLHMNPNGKSLMTHASGHCSNSVEGKQEEYLTLGDLLKWSIDVARGMKHLSDDMFIHGDLAVRNILIAADGTAKICDFGLGKNMDQAPSGVYKKVQRTLIPITRLAPECLDKNKLEYSTCSDVWAFGVVLWEMFTLGEKPFSDLEDNPAGLLCLLRRGGRLSTPHWAPSCIQEIMSNCWKMEPLERPSFGHIEGLLVKHVRKMNKTSLPGFRPSHWLVNRAEQHK